MNTRKLTALSSPTRLALGAGAVAVVLVGLAATWAAVAADDKAAKPAAGAAATAAKPALTVTVVQPQRVTLASALSANGNVAAWQEAIIGAESNGWRLAEVRVNVGDVVQRGQVLASFAAEMAQAELAQGRAAVAESEATLAEAAANAQRARDLQPTGALSAQQVQQLLTGERTAQARLEASRASLRALELRLSHTQVLAPDSGVISARLATVGAVVPAGQELFRLIRGGRLEWRAEVAAVELAQVRPGMSVRVSAPGASTPVNGRVRMVAPTVDPATRNGLVYVDLPAAGSLKAGMFARGEFDIGSSAGLTLPQGAVLLREGFSYVFVLGAGDRVAQTKVSVGRRQGDRVEIVSGLDERARVVAAGGAFLADGDVVRVVTPAAGVGPGSPAPTATAAPGAGKS
ncbi:MAG: efflux RND transporter periplasmic adaptor subunit [Rubrivivax sp.]|nr:efflux RND transporter periplasmic adaptor subunit [Rubrivivax sp.]